MLESILNPKKAGKNPLEVFIISMIFTLVAVLFSYYLFPDYSSVLSCAFITILFAPFFQHLFSAEEMKEEFAARHKTKRNLFQRHECVIKIYTVYFLGVVVAMSFLFVFGSGHFNQILFEKQINEVERLSGVDVTGNLIEVQNAGKIFANNIFVLLITFILSFLFGSGAIFVLSWNASVIAVYAGALVRLSVAKGVSPYLAYAYWLPNSLLSISLHGIPEILGYFFAGLAGGILSVGIIREKLYSEEMKKVFFDSTVFLSISIFSIFIGAFIETGSVVFSVISFSAYVIFLSFLLYAGVRK